MVGKSRGNKQVDKNAAKEKSTDSKRSKKLVKARRNLGGGQARGKSRTRGQETNLFFTAGRSCTYMRLGTSLPP